MDGNILILDYSEFEREKIKFLLKLIGSFNIIEIPSINQYYTLMDSIDDISLIIMDLAFPDEAQGFEILGLLRKSCKDIPVIIATRSEKLEYRDQAAKIGVYDYIIKPYNSSRMENSIRSVIKVENRFYYDTKGIDEIIMSFDYYIEKQFHMADAIKQPLSIIFISSLEEGTGSSSNDSSFPERKERACSTAVNTVRPMLSATDTMVLNKNGDILVVLPLTDLAYAKLCKEKVVENITADLEKVGERYADYFRTIQVTYPDEGKDFQTLMKCAFSKIADKELYSKAAIITQGTRSYANKLYSKYSRWF
ncbi:MAG: response regulator [Clostridia bacterium]|nr:response regulator [Clostridia bacterium]